MAKVMIISKADKDARFPASYRHASLLIDDRREKVILYYCRDEIVEVAPIPNKKFDLKIGLNINNQFLRIIKAMRKEFRKTLLYSLARNFVIQAKPPPWV